MLRGFDLLKTSMLTRSGMNSFSSVQKEFYRNYSNSIKKPPNILVFSDGCEKSFDQMKAILGAVLATDHYLVYHLKPLDALESPWQENNEALIMIKNPKDLRIREKIQTWLEGHKGIVKFLHVSPQDSFLPSEIVTTVTKDVIPNGHSVLSIQSDFQDISTTAFRNLLSKQLGLNVQEQENIENYPKPTSGHLVAENHQRIHAILQKLGFKSQDSKFEIGQMSVTVGKTEHFSHEKYFAKLKTLHLGRSVIHSHIMNSSFDPLESHCFTLQHGLAIVPDCQLSGRGRGGNAWLSPKGCAMFSIQLVIDRRGRLGQHASILCHLTSLAVAKAVKQNLSDVEIGLKWPNDLYVGRQSKIGGVLILTSFMDDQIVANVGVGLNLDNEKPCLSLNSISNLHLSREEYLAETFNNLEKILCQYNEDGDDYLQEYYSFWLHENQPVKVKEDESETEHEGVIKGIDEFGFLLVKLINDEHVISVQPDGNSFDMMKGLIYPKMRQ